MADVAEQVLPVDELTGEMESEAEISAEISALVESLDASAQGAAPIWAGFEPDGACSARRAVSAWPFLLYVFAWLMLAGVAVWEFIRVPAGVAVYDSPLYPLSLLIGMGMAAFGPLLILIVWVVSAARSKPGYWGRKFISSLIKGGVATFAGVVLWWLALILVDVIRLGRPF